MERAMYPADFTPWVDMEYCSDPARGKWTRLDLVDTTEELTEEGILAFSLPEPTTAFELFGADRHWVRLRLTGDEFDRIDRSLFVPREDTSGTETSFNELSGESIIARERQAQTRMPPVVHGLYLNTEWARNVESVDNEILGSSSGAANQEFSFSRTPVLEAEIWVDELDSLSQRDRDALKGDESTVVDIETGADGEVSAFWVRWTGVTDFLTSRPDSREYVLNRTTGTVTFGDGHNGRIPPADENNVRATYRTDGGDDGDVAIDVVSGLEDDIPLIDEVTNPEPGETGEPAEPTPEFVSRVSKRLRDRDMPVTKDSFERIANSVAREIEKVACWGGKAETGKAGHVTLLIVPDTDSPKPVPSEKLITKVQEEMERKGPEAVVGNNPRLTVRGPSYVEVSVEATIETASTKNVTDVQEMAEDTLTEFMHPLTGGPEGDGWEIGSAPPPAVMTNRLEELDVINRVTSITVTYREDEKKTVLTGDEEPPLVPLDVLMYSGDHDVTADIWGGA